MRLGIIVSHSVVWFGFSYLSSLGLANPYPDENLVPKDDPLFVDGALTQSSKLVLSPQQIWKDAKPMLRVQVDWDGSKGEKFTVTQTKIELSGTESALARASREDSAGSYKGSLIDAESGQVLFHDSIGTGSYYRQLTRSMTFRFPMPAKTAIFRLVAENPSSGTMEEVLRQEINPAVIAKQALPLDELTAGDLEVRMVSPAKASPKLLLTVYAEGYTAGRKEQFFTDAAKVARAIDANDFPMKDHFEIRGAFYPSNQTLGSARNLGMPIPERDTFLGLYFPYWTSMDRWYHVVYPTREARYRQALAMVPYDYPMMVVDNSEYWGVGNFRELTAIPARNGSFTYLLMHEFGHFFGLNEEYEGGGPTELEFARGIQEPWSQNITFLRDRSKVKWQQFVGRDTPLPTPESEWNGQNYGAYQGGYGDSLPSGRSHKPGYGCMMSSGSSFCPICLEAIKQRMIFDLGQNMSRVHRH